MSASSSRSLAIMAAWEPASPTESRSEGLCRLANWMSPPLPARPADHASGEPQVGVEAHDRGDAEPHLLPDLVAHDDAQVARLGDLAQAAAPGVEAQQRDPDRLVAQRVEAGQAQRLDRGTPVDLDVGVVVEEAGEGAGDELAERVAQEPGLVEELPAGLVLAGLDEVLGRVVQQVPQLGDGRLAQVGVAGGVAGEDLQRVADDVGLVGPERDVRLADLHAADEPSDQGQPAAEDDRGAALGLLGREVLPAVAEGAHGQRVDPGAHAGADDERLDPVGPAQLLVLVLGVAEDQGAVAERHHPVAEGLGRSRLAGAGLGELEDVGVGDRDVVAQHPAERVAVERAAGELVDAHLGPGRRERGRGDERPEHRRLVAGHPPRHRPAPVAAAQPRPRRARTPAAGVLEQPRLPWPPVPASGWSGGRGRSRTAAAACPARTWRRGGPRLPVRGLLAHQASPVRVRLIPSGTVEAANAVSWARSRRSGANPARRTEASRRRPNSVIRRVLGTVTVHTA